MINRLHCAHGIVCVRGGYPNIWWSVFSLIRTCEGPINSANRSGESGQHCLQKIMLVTEMFQVEMF